MDGNVCRVLSRLTGIANNIKAPIFKDKLGWDLATQLILAEEDDEEDGKEHHHHHHHAGEVNQALMELGATFCSPSGTGIDPRDPLKEYYKSTQLGRAYHSMAITTANNKNNNNNKKENDQKGKERDGTITTTTLVPSSGCAICDPMGVKTVLEKLKDNIPTNTSSTSLTVDEAARCGHAIFPLDPPKTKKREEDLAVAVVANVYKNETFWLMVKRPEKGLLAGQWEFPNVCVQTRKGKSKDPTQKSLQDGLTTYLQNELGGWIAELDRTAVKPKPLEHIFSHVKHIMWISVYKTEVEIDKLKWTTSSGREVRWMREKDIPGITSGIKKVFKAVKDVKTEKVQKRKRKR